MESLNCGGVLSGGASYCAVIGWLKILYQWMKSSSVPADGSGESLSVI